VTIISNLISDILKAPLGRDWTVEGLAEEILASIAVQCSEETRDVVLEIDSAMDSQARRLFRPFLACLAIKSATEAGMPVNLYEGSLSFRR